MQTGLSRFSGETGTVPHFAPEDAENGSVPLFRRFPGVDEHWDILLRRRAVSNIEPAATGVIRAGITPYVSFTEAGQATFRGLQAAFGFDLWMITRVTNGTATVLSVIDRYYKINPGDFFVWEDTLCARMVTGQAPRIAPAVRSAPAYAEAPQAILFQIAAYMGVPIAHPDGTLFGTLAAFNPIAMEGELTALQPLLEAQAGMLSTILAAELTSGQHSKFAERIEARGLLDRETGVQSESGWRELLTGEEERCASLGHTAAIVVIELPDIVDPRLRVGRPPKEWILRRGVEMIRESFPPETLIARTAPGTFAAVLVAAEGLEPLMKVAAGIKERFDGASVSCGTACALRDARAGLLGAWRDAARRAVADVRRGRLT